MLTAGLSPGSPEFVAGASLLALLVGALRCTLGALNGGRLVRLLPHTVLDGFVCGACWLVVATQLPNILGAAPPPDMHYLAAAAWLLVRPGLWQVGTLALSAFTAVSLLGCKRIHPLLPGAVIATLVGCVASTAGLPVGDTVGSVSAGFPQLIDPRTLPWHLVPQLASAACAISVAGVAEACAIGSRFAAQDRESWDATKELGSQGAACLVAGAFGGFPVAGSLSRSSLARTAGARTQASHVWTALAVLAFLPLGAGLLSSLPKAVLGALVATAVAPVLKPSPGLALTRGMREQAKRLVHIAPTPPNARPHARLLHHLAETFLGWATLLCTLVAGKRLELGFEAGIGLALALALAQAAGDEFAKRVVPRLERSVAETAL